MCTSSFPQGKRADKLLNYKYAFRRFSRVRTTNVRDGKAGETWSKLCNWGGWVSTLAQILEGEMYLIISFSLEKISTQCSGFKKDLVGFKSGCRC